MKKDWILFVAIALLLALGVTTLYSTVIGTEGAFEGGGIVNRQLMFIFAGLGVYFLLSYLDYRFIGHPQVIIPLLMVGAAVLVLVLIFGEEINNAKRWIDIGGVQLQPSEFMKIILILTNAWLISLRNRYSIWILVLISAVVTGIAVVLVFIEPDASTSLLLFVTWAFMIFYALPDQLRNGILLVIACSVAFLVSYAIIGEVSSMIIAGSISTLVAGIGLLFLKKWRMFVVGAMIVGVLVGLGGRIMWDHVLADYQRQRIETFLNPSADVQGSGFQVDQSKVAIGSGMLFGKGFGHGTQSKLRFLPEHQTDFVFASFAEEFGLAGSLFVLGLYCIAILRVIRIGLKSNDTFGLLIAVGFASKFLIEVFINIAMNMGLIPATGIPLPLMSAGGSIMISTMIGFGIVQSVFVHRSEIDLVDSI